MEYRRSHWFQVSYCNYNAGFINEDISNDTYRCFHFHNWRFPFSRQRWLELYRLQFAFLLLLVYWSGDRLHTCAIAYQLEAPKVIYSEYE